MHQTNTRFINGSICLIPITLVVFLLSGCQVRSAEYKGLSENIIHASKNTVLTNSIGYHSVRVDQNGSILPWYSANLGESYNDAILRAWNFWDSMETDSSGLKYYMDHHVWKTDDDPPGIAGDQFAMILSSWNLLYDYTGNESIVENMKYIADYYLAHSLSAPDSIWPDLPYPCNTDDNGVHPVKYDGDMVLGPNYLQPDKAGSFGCELIKLYKRTLDQKYLNAAVKIADTLAEKVQPGDSNNSPWPFRVNAVTGEVGVEIPQPVWYKDNEKFSDQLRKNAAHEKRTSYTSNWTGTLQLFDALIKLDKGNVKAYQKAFDVVLHWLRKYPAKNNKWGPFFEDVSDWSDAQINAVNYAIYLLEHPELDPNWKQTVKSIFNWVRREFEVRTFYAWSYDPTQKSWVQRKTEVKDYAKYGVICTGEQTIYRAPGNSHSARQASAELMYWEKTGDTSYAQNAVRELSWATYWVDFDGKSRYPNGNIWMTDGYGDFVIHYLRAMAAAPQLAPDNADHLLKTSSIVQKISYSASEISYKTFDGGSEEKFKLTSKPRDVRVNGTHIEENAGHQAEEWIWQPFKTGGILTVEHTSGNAISILK